MLFHSKVNTLSQQQEERLSQLKKKLEPIEEIKDGEKNNKYVVTYIHQKDYIQICKLLIKKVISTAELNSNYNNKIKKQPTNLDKTQQTRTQSRIQNNDSQQISNVKELVQDTIKFYKKCIFQPKLQIKLSCQENTKNPQTKKIHEGLKQLAHNVWQSWEYICIDQLPSNYSRKLSTIIGILDGIYQQIYNHAVRHSLNYSSELFNKKMPEYLRLQLNLIETFSQKTNKKLIKNENRQEKQQKQIEQQYQPMKMKFVQLQKRLVANNQNFKKQHKNIQIKAQIESPYYNKTSQRNPFLQSYHARKKNAQICEFYKMTYYQEN